MRDHYEQRLFRQVSTTAALDAAIQEMDKEYEQQKRRSAASLTESSDQDSFVSALEVCLRLYCYDSLFYTTTAINTVGTRNIRPLVSFPIKS